MITVGSLFAGIGGIDLGLERTGGFKTIWFSEIDPYCNEVLGKNFPRVPNIGDITKVDWNGIERPDMLVGGFPCQDISWAGKGAGIKEGTRSGLWSEYAKAIRHLRPKLVLVENVPALTHRGLSRVLASLAEAGYDAEWFTLSAAEVGAMHRRERLFIIAYPNGCGCGSGGDYRGGGQVLRPEIGQASEACPKWSGREPRAEPDASDNASDSHCGGFLHKESEIQPAEGGEQTLSKSKSGVHDSNTDNRCELRTEICARRDATEGEIIAPNSDCDRNREMPIGFINESIQGGSSMVVQEGTETTPRQIHGSDSCKKRVYGFVQEQIRQFPDFSWCKDIRKVEDLRNRPDIPQPLIRGSADGVSRRMDNYTRTERTKAVGNAVCPQVAQQIGEWILAGLEVSYGQ